jgi:hypothetical protein
MRAFVGEAGVSAFTCDLTRAGGEREEVEAGFRRVGVLKVSDEDEDDGGCDEDEDEDTVLLDVLTL